MNLKYDLDFFHNGVESRIVFSIRDLRARCIMTTISSVSPASISGYNAPLANAANSASPASHTNAQTNATQTAANASAIASTITTLNNAASAPLTYSPNGLLKPTQSVQPAQPVSTALPVTPLQTAQTAVLAAQNVVTQTMDSMFSTSPASSSASNLFSTGAAANDPLGLASPTANSPTGTSSSSAQTAYLAAQNAVTQALNSII
jgi:hypothetical protein